MKVLSDLDVLGKRVFLRADLDVPLEQSTVYSLQSTEAATRLVNLKPTVEYLLEHGASQVFIAGHMGRPSGPDLSLSTRQLEEPLEMILRRSVTYKKDFDTGDGTLASMAQLLLFENLRFWPGEEKNDAEFAKQLAGLADVYVNDAFAVCHREHASVVGVPKLLPHAAGLHLAKEVNQLTKLIREPERPYVAIIGGAKIETKVPVVANLAKVADWVLVGGEIAKQLTMVPFSNEKDNLQLTTDKNLVNWSNVIGQMSNVIVATLTDDGKDIDQDSIEKFKPIIAGAKTIVWNGPMGVFEEGFDAGTVAIAQAIGESGAYSVVGGGETVEFLGSKGLLEKFSFVSSGGGAMLEFLAGKTLPGITALE